MSRTTANLLLLLTAAIWGAAFVAQSTAMTLLSPLWFVALRFILTAIVSAPLAFVEARQRPRPIGWGDLGVMAGLTASFVAGVIVQQQGILKTTVTNAGFLTSLYVLFTPFVALVMLGHRLASRDFLTAGLALVGAWLMSGGLSGIGIGDAFIAASALFWAMQLVFMEKAVKQTGRPFFVVFAQYVFTAAIALAIALAVDPIDWAAIRATWPEVVYAGVFSGGVGYTLQAVAQKHTRSSDAAIIFAMEAPFAMLAGALLLGERIGFVGAIGAALIFVAVLIVSLMPARKIEPA